MNRELIYLTHVLVSAPVFIYGHDRADDLSGYII